jgi:hypothetical protein
MTRKLLATACAIEIGTGIAVLIVPGVVVGLLLGAELDGAGRAAARCFGIALLALGVACWPPGAQRRDSRPAARAMLLYNAMVAMFLAYLSVFAAMQGLLLWPAVVLHGVLAASFFRASQLGRSGEAATT